MCLGRAQTRNSSCLANWTVLFELRRLVAGLVELTALVVVAVVVGLQGTIKTPPESLPWWLPAAYVQQQATKQPALITRRSSPHIQQNSCPQTHVMWSQDKGSCFSHASWHDGQRLKPIGFNCISYVARSLKFSQELDNATEVAHLWSTFHMFLHCKHLEMPHDLHCRADCITTTCSVLPHSGHECNSMGPRTATASTEPHSCKMPCTCSSHLPGDHQDCYGHGKSGLGITEALDE